MRWTQLLFLVVVALAVSFVGVGQVSAFSGCPAPESRPGAFGPWDYTNPEHRAKHLAIVESYHFRPEVEHLRGSNTRSIADDISYTLNTFPNHHRALRSMTRLVIQEDSLRPSGLRRSLDCWFSRARRFNPTDGVVPMIHGMYYYDRGEYEEALGKMRESLDVEPENPNILYNIGLVYFELGRYEEAREHARKAYDAGFPLEGLRRKLSAAGHWSE